MSKHKQLFYRFSSLITAADLQCRLGSHVESDANAYEMFLQLSTDESCNWGDSISLVMRGSEVVGWWSALGADVDEENPAVVSEIMNPIHLTMLVSGDTTYYDLAYKFANRSHSSPFFVLDGSDITGTVSYSDLFSRTGQLCLLSLTFMLESIAEQLCLLDRVKCWSQLSPKSQRSAKKIAFEKRFNKQLLSDDDFPADTDLVLNWNTALWIKSTYLIDKGTMIVGAELLTSSDAEHIEKVFERAKEVRDLCSHCGDEQEFILKLSRDEFASFIRDTQNLVEDMSRRLNELT